MNVVQHTLRVLTTAEQISATRSRGIGDCICGEVTKFHIYIFGRHILFQSDHAPLSRIFGSNKGIPVYTANHLERWALSPFSYDFSKEYVATEKFWNADVLSHPIDQHIKPDIDFVVACTSLEEDLQSVVNSTISQPFPYGGARNKF